MHTGAVSSRDPTSLDPSLLSVSTSRVCARPTKNAGTSQPTTITMFNLANPPPPGAKYIVPTKTITAHKTSLIGTKK